jgi:Transposase IS4
VSSPSSSTSTTGSQVRRSSRVRGRPVTLAQEQEHYETIQDERKAWVAATALINLSDEPNIDMSSDEEAAIVDEAEDDEEDAIHPPIVTVDEHGWDSSLTDFTIPPFAFDVGPTTDIDRPLPLLQLFLTPRLMRRIAAATTSYARSKGAASDWSTDSSELYRLIAVHIAMGIQPCPMTAMYWCAGWSNDFIWNTMARNRYWELIRYFHVVDPSVPYNSTTPLVKVQPLISDLQSSFQMYYQPARDICIDEAMIPYKVIASGGHETRPTIPKQTSYPLCRQSFHFSTPIRCFAVHWCSCLRHCPTQAS